MFPATRRRRTKQELAELDGAIAYLAEMHQPLTIRNLFYVAESKGLLDKSEKAYKWLCDRTVKLRRSERIASKWIRDMSRSGHIPGTWEDLSWFLEEMERSYRMDKWRHMPRRVEVWTEKDAIVPVIEQVLWEYDIPLYSCKGYPSLSLLDEAESEWPEGQQPVTMLYFGDHDPSGKDIPRFIAQEMAQRARGRDVQLRQCAVTKEQIVELGLPTRPTKKKDSRTAAWTGGESVEIDSIPPNVLRQMVEGQILNGMEDAREQWQRLVQEEDGDREKMSQIIDSIRHKVQWR
ncbi:MAG: hypothetical protein OXE49_01480 [Gemmatimonadetes bacterium]|nr:hypothetical protein [Gemmatimonadota bacterium]